MKNILMKMKTVDGSSSRGGAKSGYHLKKQVWMEGRPKYHAVCYMPRTRREQLIMQSNKKYIVLMSNHN